MLEITGATLLSIEEAKQLDEKILKAPDVWWLRSPGYSDNFAAFVYGGDGDVDDVGYNVADAFGVRPALTISNLESSSLKIGDSITFGDHDFTIISDKYALCNVIVDECVFREDYLADDANDYEASDVKVFVDQWFEMLKERESGLEMEKTKIGSITCSSEYLAGGDIAQRGYTSTYYRIGEKYYEDYFSFDDYGEGDEEPVRYEVEREEIVKAFAEAHIHENTYTDIYAGNLDALADESVSYEIRDEQIQKEVERYVEDTRITKHTKEEHDSLKDIWLNGAESGEHSNSHVSVQMFIKDFTDADKEHFEDLILQDQDKRRLFGGFEGVFYADITDHGSYKELSFDLYKGDFEAAKRLSKIYPEAVVFVNDDWDEHNYEIYRNGKEYNDYTAEWDGDEPEPYREDGEEDQYDIDVKVGIRLPFADAVQTCYSGGGDCYEEEFLWYKNQIDIHPKEQNNEEREL